jgi:hypothetical protein
MQLKDGKLVPAGEGKTVDVASVPTPPMPPTRSQEEIIYGEMQKRFAQEQQIAQSALQQRQYVEQPQYQEQPQQQQPQQSQHILVKINFVGGTTVDIAIPKEIARQFLDELALKTKLKDLMTIENRVINCELVTDFVVE